MIVWIPMLDDDERPAAVAASDPFRALGVPQFWDGEQKLGRAVAGSLAIPDWVAWDIYLFYPPGAKWTEGGLPPPEAALAQAGGVVVATPGTLPPSTDQSKLSKRMRGRAEVVGDQSEIEALLSRVAKTYAKKHSQRR
jgi:hypothetical protein